MPRRATIKADTTPGLNNKFQFNHLFRIRICVFKLLDTSRHCWTCNCKVLSSLCLSTNARCLYQSAPHLQPSTSASRLPHQQPHAVALLVCVGIRVSSVTFLFFSDTSVRAGHGPMVWLRRCVSAAAASWCTGWCSAGSTRWRCGWCALAALWKRFVHPHIFKLKLCC